MRDASRTHITHHASLVDMNKDSILYGIIGLLIGIMIGFFATNSINRSALVNAPTTVSGGAGAGGTGAALPPGHPPLDSAGSGSAEATAAATAASEKARKEPSNFDAQMQAASLNYQSRSYQQALEFYNRAYQLKPNDFEALTGLGNANYDLDRYAEAEGWYQQALQLKPDAVDVRSDLGSTYLLREPRDLDKAIAAYRGALSYNPRHEKTLQNLTVALLEKGDKTAAREMLKRLEEINPSNQALPELRSKAATP